MRWSISRAACFRKRRSASSARGISADGSSSFFRGSGCRLLCHSADYDPKVAQIAEYTDLDTLYQSSDILTFHVPLLPSTKHMVNAEALKKMKEGVVLINTARGELFETEALIGGVENRKIGALAMDVFEGEDGIYHMDRTDDLILQPRYGVSSVSFPM